MKINSKILIMGGAILFSIVLFLRFNTIQKLDTSSKNFHIYSIKGKELFAIKQDSNQSIVKIYDDRVKVKGFFEKTNDGFKVYPYAYIEIKDNNNSLIYQFVANTTQKDFIYPVRFRKFELIGGSHFDKIKSLVRLNSKDKPLLLLLPNKEKKIFGKTNKTVRIIALQSGIIYIDEKGDIKKVPQYSGTKLYQLEKLINDGTIKPVKISNKGIITTKDKKFVLNISLVDGVVSKKKGAKYIAVKTKKFKIVEYHNYSHISSLVLSSASKKYYLKKNNQIYLTAPKNIPIDKDIIVKGIDSMFDFKKYGVKADFDTSVPILDKPKISYKSKKSFYYDYLDINHLYGLFVDDINATIYYSTDKKRWIKAKSNYKYAPPVYLYYSNIQGKYIAPSINNKYSKKFYYKIISKKDNLKIAFAGKLKIYSNNIFLKEEKGTIDKLIDINGKNTLIEVYPKPLAKCGELFTLPTKKELQYSLNDNRFKPLIVSKSNNGYVYKIQERLNPFKEYKVVVKGYKEFNYKPQLRCRFDKPLNSKIISLYDKANMHSLIPKYVNNKIIKNLVTTEKNSSKEANYIPNILLPIYGDGIRFGLLSKGVKKEQLTIDINFTKTVAKIFEEKIAPLLKNKKLQDRLKRVDEQIEGATVVIKIDKKGNREIIALFSYPYPKGSLEQEIILDRLNYRASRLRNRAFDMLVHPGSTFKMVTSIALAQKGLLQDFPVLAQRQDLYGTPFRDANITFHLKNYSDARGITETTKYTNFTDAFAHSYNTYFGYAGLNLFKKFENRYYENLFPINLNIQEREKEYYLTKVAKSLFFNKKIPLSKKYNITTTASQFPTIYTTAKSVADSAIGQHEVYATPLQMALVASVLYDNKLILPKIIKDEESKLIAKNIVQKENLSLIGKVFKSDKELNIIQEAMQKVITHGTAKKAFKGFKSKICKVYGKTGTAQKGKKGLYDGWFVAFTKGLENNIIVATVIKNSGVGADYSAPINRAIIEAWIKKELPSKKAKGKR